VFFSEHGVNLRLTGVGITIPCMYALHPL
jgi:hypothetical protein